MGLAFDPIEEARRNWDRHAWNEIPAMAAATSITRAHQILLARINEALGPIGLTFSRFEALALLYFAREHALPLGKIGARLQVHPTSVTNTIDRLEADGLVERQPHPTDRRTTLAVLTETGIDVAEQGAEILGGIEFGLKGLDKAECESLTETVATLRSAAGDF